MGINSLENIKDRNIICDTCILIGLTHKRLNKGLVALLDILNENENQFCISEYALFELFRGQTKEGAKKYLQWVDTYINFPVSDEVLSKAADLINDYKHCKKVDSVESKKISEGDLILAATSFVNQNTCILTENESDFPRPFFSEIGRHYVAFKDKDEKEQFKTYFILEPDLVYEAKVFQSRD